jgi:tight adherence protein C
MLTPLLWALAFAAGATAMLGGVAAGRLLLERNPRPLAEFRDSRLAAAWPLRVWRLAIQVAARELPGTRLEARRRQIAADLARAAEPAEVTAEAFLGQAVLEGLAVAVVSALVMLATIGRPVLLVSLGFGVAHAFLLRPHQLHTRAARRAARISRQLPYAIDLAVLVLGAGGTLREALTMLSEKAERDALAEELAVALGQMRAGTPQGKALLDMANRVQLEELSTLVIAINRGEETGAPMAKALATQAEIFRFRRLQRAERLAVEAPVKMMFPNMIIMLSVLLIVLGPVFVKLVTQGLF